MSPRDPLVSAFTLLGLQVHTAMPSFLCECWRVNSGPSICAVSAFSTESSLQIRNHKKQELNWSVTWKTQSRLRYYFPPSLLSQSASPELPQAAAHIEGHLKPAWLQQTFGYDPYTYSYPPASQTAVKLCVSTVSLPMAGALGKMTPLGHKKRHTVREFCHKP